MHGAYAAQCCAPAKLGAGHAQRATQGPRMEVVSGTLTARSLPLLFRVGIVISLKVFLGPADGSIYLRRWFGAAAAAKSLVN